MKLWIDDLRPAPEGWKWHKNSQHALIDIIYNSELIEEISFDHDLGEDSQTGYDIICRIEEMVAYGTWKGNYRFHIHSANPVGRQNMQRAIDSIFRMLTLQASR